MQSKCFVNSMFVTLCLIYFLFLITHSSEAIRKTIGESSRHYVRTLQWMLNCYYGQPCSWSWFYQFWRTPYVSDIAPIVASVNLDFDKDVPLRPFEQLLAVLPPGNKSLLPTAFHWLMEDVKSPIIDYYFLVIFIS